MKVFHYCARCLALCAWLSAAPGVFAQTSAPATIPGQRHAAAPMPIEANRYGSAPPAQPVPDWGSPPAGTVAPAYPPAAEPIPRARSQRMQSAPVQRLPQQAVEVRQCRRAPCAMAVQLVDEAVTDAEAARQARSTLAQSNQRLRAEAATLRADDAEMSRRVTGGMPMQSANRPQPRPVTPGAAGFDTIQSARVGALNPNAAISYTTSPAEWCRQMGDTPRLRATRLADDHFTPGGLFVLQGSCFGRESGTVQLLFPESNRLVTIRDADWNDNKIVGVVPADLRGLLPATLQVQVLRSDRRSSEPLAAPFWPAFEQVAIPANRLRLARCNRRCGRLSLCYASDGSRHIDQGYFDARPDVPGFPSKAAPGQAFASAGHYTPPNDEDYGGVGTARCSGERAPEPAFGDVFRLDLPPYAQIVGSTTRKQYFPEHNLNFAVNWVPAADGQGSDVTVSWVLTNPRPGNESFFHYELLPGKAWVPAGVGL